MLSRILGGLRKALYWAICAFIAFLMILSPWTQPVMASLATVPVLKGISEPYTKILLGTLMFMGMIWLMNMYAEIALIICARQVNTIFKVWKEWFTVARTLRKEAPVAF